MGFYDFFDICRQTKLWPQKLDQDTIFIWLLDSTLISSLVNKTCISLPIQENITILKFVFKNYIFQFFMAKFSFRTLKCHQWQTSHLFRILSPLFHVCFQSGIHRTSCPGTGRSDLVRDFLNFVGPSPRGPWISQNFLVLVQS